MHTSFWFLIILLIINIGLTIDNIVKDDRNNDVVIPLVSLLSIFVAASVFVLFYIRKFNKIGTMLYIHKRIILNIFVFILYYSGLILLAAKSEDLGEYLISSWVIASAFFLALMTHSLVYK